MRNVPKTRMGGGRKGLLQPPKQKANQVRDPVEVYSRLKPLDIDEAQCVIPINSTSLQLVPPDVLAMTRPSAKEYSFKYIFDDKTSQKALFDHVALPLVDDVLHGKNGLLFTYGVTGSGKTYTMTGTPDDGGIMPRCIDVIFNSIGECQARRFVFKPDKMNGFEVQSEADALLEAQSQLNDRTPRLARRKEADVDLGRIPDQTKIEGIDEDTVYAVFVTYIEVYNNFVYDLLDDAAIDPINPRRPQTRIIREDANHNMFVFSAVELEVKTPDEAFEAFYKGQKMKRVAHTTLNQASSRSHSIFTIRIVQSPLDPQGEEVVLDKNAMCVSQLSLVDLAGSERSARTNNTGQRLAEAGSINNSLMDLRQCIEILKENQTQGTNKLIPYRASKITLLFKNFFEGEGRLKMVLCINPKGEDYNENVHVLMFAELTQEVQIARPSEMRLDFGMTPGRKRGHQLFRENQARVREEALARVLDLDDMMTSPTMYTLGPSFPDVQLISSTDDLTLPTIMAFLEDRLALRQSFLSETQKKEADFRIRLMDLERRNECLLKDKENMQVELDETARKLHVADEKVSKLEHTNLMLHAKISTFERTKKTLEQELDQKEMLLNRGECEKVRMKAQLNGKIATERERVARQMEKKMRDKHLELASKNFHNAQSLQAIKDVVDSTNIRKVGPLPPPRQHLATASYRQPGYNLLKPASSDTKIDAAGKEGGNKKGRRSITPPPQRTIPVANPRHRRSRSGGNGEMWIDHRPAGSLEMDTLLQPQMKKKKSVSRINVKDVTKDASKYCLLHQEQDSGGDIETHVFKGDVVPTAGGGAQIIFNDVEKLTHESPKNRKRSHSNSRRNTAPSPGELDTKCSFGIQGRGGLEDRWRPKKSC